jgi:hypothetical protein
MVDDRAELDWLMRMPKQERKRVLTMSKLADEQAYLEYMISNNKHDSDLMSDFAYRAREFVAEGKLDEAENCTEIVKLLKGQRFTIGEIRKQREKIQWVKKRLKNIKPNDSSKNLES